MLATDSSAVPSALNIAPSVQANDAVELVADEAPDDNASELRESIASSSTSITSSILDYRIENGRTYHKYKDGQYHIPNDASESDRLDLQHNLFLLTLDNKLGLAPPNAPDSKVNRALDVGTGTGIWAVDFGEEHPEAEVLGIDLSPSMPQFIPPNVRFEIDDLEEPWVYSQPFDYIHTRAMNSSITDWKVYIKKCFDNLNSGGFLELQEYDVFVKSDDGTLKPEHAVSRCVDLIYDASIKFGRPYQHIEPLAEMMREVGFVDVAIQSDKWPSNAWARDPKYKELGMWNHENMSSGVEGFTMAAFTRIHNWTKEEVQAFLVDVRKDLKDRSIHGYWTVYNIHGRKP
ncbi:hypothetical protein HER10_EVM0007297 [Colletotrichum scovillei]|uniref:uncharacterized protein n=1 Tax=Colletotrichum scovillei TaxID=1209932 RepID=UPI0015C3C607|nr:uncharacterized protein HER10_EVM0007297 [Colletotrichum scovillei]KAF4773972.1 hypothetical protein HER10_EVM0007297 [Colletotrichum scovillei]